MTPYWFMFLLPALGVYSPYRADAVLARVLWFTVAALFVLIMGLRVDVGCDWVAYLEYLDRSTGVSFAGAVVTGDPAYMAVNWLGAQWGGGIYFVNLVCALLVMWGVATFARQQPLPWLALLVAVPYMLVVVAMGYTRQSVALGFELLALVALMNGQQRRFVFYVLCGALFHKSAVLLLPLAALATSEKKLVAVLWVGLTTLLIGALVLFEHQQALWENYVVAGMVSEGGGIRVAMNVVPALLFLAFRKRLAATPLERRLWGWIALFSLLCIPLVGVASTAVDRVALYFMPIQIYVFARIGLLAYSRWGRTVLVTGVVLGYATTQWVWLHYATHAHCWLPYRFAPLG